MNEKTTPDPQPLAKTPQREGPKTLEQIVRDEAPEVFNAIPANKRPQLARLSLTKYVETVSVRSGPLPEPSELAAYDKIIPNGADRIMKMGEAQSAHRIHLEKLVVGSQQRQALWGQVFGFVMGITVISLATYAAVHGQAWFGSVIGGTTVVSLVSVFVYSQRKQKAELAEKSKQMQSGQPTPRPKAGKK